MFETYNVDGQKYEVSQDQLQRFLKDFPNAVKEGKAQGSTVDPTVSQDNTGSKSEDGSSESKNDDINWFDQTWFGRGYAAASTTGEATDLFMEGSDVNMETIQEFIKAKEGEAKAHVPSEAMNRFQKKYQEEGSGWTAFFRGVKEEPGLLSELFVQSLGTQVGTFFDSDKARIATGVGAAAGAGATAYLGAGAIGGGMAGAMGGLATSMETALTFGELIETELAKDELEFTDVNIKALLESSKGKEIRNKAIGRGLTIGAIEALTGGVAGKLTTGVLKGAKTAGKAVSKTRKVAAAGAGIVVEGVGGGVGEVGGRLAAGQEMDAAEIGFEAITGTTTAPLNVGGALLRYKKPVYKLNGKVVEYKEMKDFVETADDVDVAKANIVMENDLSGLDAVANKKQTDAITDSQVDKLVTDKKDRAKLVQLEYERRKADFNAKKKGIDQVPGAEEKLAKVQAEIDGIIGKYDGAIDKSLTEGAAEVRKAQRENNLQDTIDFLQKNKKYAGKDVVIADGDAAAQLAHDKAVEEYNAKNPDNKIKAEDVSGSDGFIVGDVIVINKDIAGQTGAINVGAHELLHGIMGKHMKTLDDAGKIELGKSFMDVLTKDQDAAVRKRLKDNYNLEGDNIFASEEIFTAFSDAITKGEITFDKGVFGKLKEVIERILKGKGYNKEFENGKAVYDFLKDYQKSVTAGSEISTRAQNLAAGGTTATDTKASQSVSPEKLVRIIKNPKKTTREIRAAEDDLTKQFDLLALKALKYDTRKGDISRDAVRDEARKYLPGIIKRFNPTTSKFSTFVNSNMAPKQAVIYEKVKGLTYGDTISIDTKEAREIVDDTSTVEKGPDTRRKKTNVLKIGRVERKADAIRKIVKVKDGDTFKEVSDNNTGKVAQEIFDVPANKITDPKKNLTYAKKIVEGIPEASEAGNIQSFYTDPQTAEKLIKILPEESVSSDTADINEIGENIDVDREVLGRGLGLNNRMLNYFYEKTNKRSKGKTSQPFIWKLKSEFKNPTPENVKQFQENLGITPRGELNNYNRNIGQLLKGVAKFQAQQTALSTAQRILTEQKAPKKQIASITTAQSKVAFSNSTQRTGRLMRQNLRIDDAKFRDKLLSINKLAPTLRIKKETDIKTYIDMLKKDVFPLLPKAAWFGPGKGTAFDSSSKGIGVDSSSDPLWIKFQEEIKKLKNDDSIVYGPDIKGVDMGSMWSLRTKYTPLFSTPEKARKNIKNGEITKFNEQVGLIHKALWKRINKSIKNTKGESASGIATYLGLVANDTGHWHKMGAQFAGFSKKITKRKKDKKGKDQKSRVEYEHAMVATEAYIYLLDAAINHGESFDYIYGKIIENYKLIALDKAMDDKLKNARTKSGRSLMTNMPDDWNAEFGSWWERYFNNIVGEQGGGIDPSSIEGLDGKTFAETLSINAEGNSSIVKTGIQHSKTLNKAIAFSRSTNNETKGITVLDFDDTLATSKSLIRFTKPDGTKGTLNAEQYASTYQELTELGYKWDFSEFNKVVDGKTAPLFNKAMKLQGKFGPENMFVLTARPAEAAPAIFAFLQANGLNIPLKNITGLANSTAEAKALWMVDKVSDGYNDFYFADDALQNVKAVKNMLDQFDVKSKVQQARVKFSNSMNENFNDILESLTGIESKKRFDSIKGRKRGESKGKFRFFIPPSHEDFVGLLYNFMGKGKEGNKHRDFLEQALVRPINRANREYDTARQSIANDYKALNKQFEDVKAKLTEKTSDGDFTNEDAIRIYLWDKHDHNIPGLSPIDQKNLVELVNSNQELKAYAETLNVISKQETYVNPTEGWNAGDIRMDLDDATGRVGREQYFAEFNENAEIIFSTENLNKIEAGYGKGVRVALEDILYRIKTGRNRPSGSNETVNKFMNFLNGSVGTVMFFNMRSALLQQMSIVNYINFADNNIFAAAKAFANQKQYWADFAFIFNSDMLKQRRGGIQTDVNGAELAASLRKSKNPSRVLISKLLELGFLPTQIGDNIAIATGGAAYYRNTINKYVKQGMSIKEAEAAAFTDFQDITQSTQQSARPDMVSMQQASVLGKVILNFQNVTSQFNRLGKKAFQDIYNRRITKPNSTQMQSDISNAARITYYFAVQNMIFYTLQTALFAMMFDDDEEDNNNLFLKKKERLINGSIDSVLRGSGVMGGVIATLKNTAIAFARQRDVDYNPDESAVVVEALNLSPVIGIKARQIVNAEKTLNYNKKIIDEMETFDIDNPQWSAVTNYVQTFTNLPLNRLYNKTQNFRQALNNQNSAWERSLMFLGWSQYNLDIKNEKMEQIKKDVKSKKKKKTNTRTNTRTRTRTRIRTR